MSASNNTADGGRFVEPSRAFPGMPRLRVIGFNDIGAALAAGIADFKAAPLYGLFFGGLFALAGIVIVLSVTRLDMPWLAYPLAIGFPLLGPFAAAGLYEVSRRLQSGEELSFGAVLSLMWRQRTREFSWMAFVVLFIFWIWVYQVRLLVAIFLGFKSFSTLPAFLSVVTGTTEGLMFLAVGHVVGAVLSLVLYSVTVISVPFLTERNTDFITAIATSIRAVFASPVVMLGWGLCVTVAMIAAMLPAFLGLIVVMPVLGHATWHLYKRIAGEPEG